ncbi:hypothetical protein [Nocardia noduli]|uniref:hypothetical protein n=1 Tax=Nocardia noduli TaxID=2815722 RepID=UPI001C22F9D4|nr:hypothetical protein [Nocardia noduli]
MESGENGEFLFDPTSVAGLEKSLTSGFQEFQSMILAGRDPADILSGVHGMSVAQACIAAGAAVGNVSLDLGLDLLSLSDNVRTVIDTLTSHDAKQSQDMRQLMGDLE